jgi:adenine-specific DNA-methyltransferase
MSAINDLVRQITDPDLREKLQKEVNKLAKQKKFGLVFEEHLPECTPLWDMPVRRGAKVALRSGPVSDFYQVVQIKKGMAQCIRRGESEAVEFSIGDLVPIAEFGEPIYPYLKPIDAVCNAPDNDLWHTLIEADNYHALQLLEYLYAGKVDCIYIDPPYNTGARDWKYNNDYVDSTDQYRHSKWLSMMQKRLRIAKKLLNPNESVLIITIDEKEYLHLGCLLEEMFPEATTQMISSVINPSGSKRLNEFSRSDEYIFFVMIGAAVPCGIKTEASSEKNSISWETFRRHDLQSKRGTSKGGTAQFYPLYVDTKTGKIAEIGNPIPPNIDIKTVPNRPGCTTVFPIRDNGIEMNWGARPETARELLKNGYLKAGERKENTPQKYVVKYLTSGTIEDIKDGTAIVDGYDTDGSIIAHYENGKDVMPKTNWNEKSHNANAYGSKIIKDIIGNRFSFPKSLYAVHDCIDLFVRNKPNAIVIDFFAGSGTTLHAVNLLNAEDGGHRRCILVTNNEVSDDEAKEMSSRGLKPGDEEWEKLGIAQYVTWPRTVCSIEGHDVKGNPLKGTYLGSDFPMADGFKSNAAYFKLGFLDKTSVALGMQFKEMLPTLWMKAGSHGPCPSLTDTPADMLILAENRMAVLMNENDFSSFSEKVNAMPEIKTVFIITDYDINYRNMVSALKGKTTFQLYRDYLDNFRINYGRN